MLMKVKTTDKYIRRHASETTGVCTKGVTRLFDVMFVPLVARRCTCSTHHAPLATTTHARTHTQPPPPCPWRSSRTSSEPKRATSWAQSRFRGRRNTGNRGATCRTAVSDGLWLDSSKCLAACVLVYMHVYMLTVLALTTLYTHIPSYLQSTSDAARRPPLTWPSTASWCASASSPSSSPRSPA